MRTIRAVNPGALHVVTEDLGKTFSTPRMAYQARHENHRRWLSLDLLTGRVDDRDPFWPMLMEAGVDPAVLAQLVQQEAAPDIIGINHYLTSERYLDERKERYPEQPVGTNGIDSYVDVEAVRMP